MLSVVSNSLVLIGCIILLASLGVVLLWADRRASGKREAITTSLPSRMSRTMRAIRPGVWVLSESIVTMMSRGSASSRSRR